MEILENAYRFAVHLSVCKKATDEDRALAAQQLSKSKKYSSGGTPRNSVPGDAELYNQTNGRASSNEYGVAHRHSEGCFDTSRNYGPASRVPRGSDDDLRYQSGAMRDSFGPRMPPFASYEDPYGYGSGRMMPPNFDRTYSGGDPYRGGGSGNSSDNFDNRVRSEYAPNGVSGPNRLGADPSKEPSVFDGPSFQDRLLTEYDANGNRRTPPDMRAGGARSSAGYWQGPDFGASFQDRVDTEYDADGDRKVPPPGLSVFNGGEQDLPPPANRHVDQFPDGYSTGPFEGQPLDYRMYGRHFPGQGEPNWWGSSENGAGPQRRGGAGWPAPGSWGSEFGGYPGLSYGAPPGRNPYQQGGRPDDSYNMAMAHSRSYDWEGARGVPGGGSGMPQQQRPNQPAKYDFVDNPAAMFLQAGDIPQLNKP